MTTYLFSRTEPTGRRTLRAVNATDEQEARTIARTQDAAVWTRLAAGEVAEFTEMHCDLRIPKPRNLMEHFKIPDMYLPFPPIPEGYDKWEWRGWGWTCNNGPARYIANCALQFSGPVKWDVLGVKWPEGIGCYIEAVKLNSDKKATEDEIRRMQQAGNLTDELSPEDFARMHADLWKPESYQFEREDGP